MSTKSDGRKSGTEMSNDDFKDFNSPSAGPAGRTMRRETNKQSPTYFMIYILYIKVDYGSSFGVGGSPGFAATINLGS